MCVTFTFLISDVCSVIIIVYGVSDESGIQCLVSSVWTCDSCIWCCNYSDNIVCGVLCNDSSVRLCKGSDMRAKVVII